MIATVERRLRRSWHHLRHRMGAHAVVPNRLVVDKARWLNDARSPVVLMIENHRTGLLWKLFMSNPEIDPALEAIGFRRE